MQEKSTIEAVLDIRSEEELKSSRLFDLLAEEINHLIRNDFNKLISILYRIDVSESKLKELLRSHPDQEAGKIIGVLMLERQIQKIRMKAKTSEQKPPSGDQETW